jgi:hypothetical protein
MSVATSISGVGDRVVPRERIRTMRMQRHLAVAVLACAAFVASGPSVYSLLEVVILSAFIGVGLGSLARAADARLGYGWGWLYGEPVYSTRLDLLVDGILHRLISVVISHSSAAKSAVDAADHESKIRILPLESEHR